MAFVPISRLARRYAFSVAGLKKVFVRLGWFDGFSATPEAVEQGIAKKTELTAENAKFGVRKGVEFYFKWNEEAVTKALHELGLRWQRRPWNNRL